MRDRENERQRKRPQFNNLAGRAARWICSHLLCQRFCLFFPHHVGAGLHSSNLNSVLLFSDQDDLIDRQQPLRPLLMAHRSHSFGA